MAHCLVWWFTGFVFQQLSDVEMAKWANEQMYAAVAGVALPPGMALQHIAMSIAWFFMFAFFLFVCYWWGVDFASRAGWVVFYQVIEGLMAAPIPEFYDKQPVGRIMNRLTADMRAVDMSLFFRMTAIWGIGVAFFVPMSYVHMNMPLAFSIGCIFVYGVLIVMCQVYWNVMVPCKYLETVCVSATTGILTETMPQNVEVRAFKVLNQRRVEFAKKYAYYLKSKFLNGACMNCWIGTRTICVYSIVIGILALYGINFPDKMPAGTFGLCITNCFAIMTGVPSQIELGALFQFDLISLQRLMEYSEIKPERPYVLESDTLYSTRAFRVDRWAMGDVQLRENPTRLVRYDAENREEQVLAVVTPNERALVLPEKGVDWNVLHGTHYNLSIVPVSHKLVAVQGVSGNGKKILEALCSTTSKEVALEFRGDWLINGLKVEIQDLVCGYGDSPNILKGISCTFEAQDRVGIVGTTGSGKSTIMLALLRVVEPRQGKIIFNGKDCAQLGLHTVRRAMGLVPQDPLLFKSSIRENIDPMGSFTDAVLWSALEMCQLKPLVEGMPLQLQEELSQGGLNLSFGQRQLMCIARMVLRQPALLLLDEATSAIDPYTQDLVQSTIRNGFPTSTIIAVAHRLETLFQFDSCVVLSKGIVVEKGGIQELRDNKDSTLAKMIAARTK
jgi:ABC-type multidrug transport system fused ATPase/permease subunit